jgi:chorismate dehydratase
VSGSTRVRLGAVSYLNARPLVYGLEAQPRFDVRYDIPSECARLLHDDRIDVGLIPSIEYLRGPSAYGIVPGPAVISTGRVASVALFTRREPADIRRIAMDTSSRTSVALATVLARRAFGIAPQTIAMAPDLDAMLGRADAALIIGDYALLVDHAAAGVRKIDLGELWTEHTGLPFVYAFWAGRPDLVTPDDVALLQQARDAGVEHSDDVAREYFRNDPARQVIAASYLRNNIQYYLGDEAYAGLQAFYRYAAELNLVSFDGQLRIYHAEHHGAR